MTLNIVEVAMKRQWHIQRQFQAAEDGERRWDQAYQLLLHWSTLNESPPASAPLLSTQRPKEGADENRRLCPRLDAAPEPGPDD
jgi:hypothetical protein